MIAVLDTNVLVSGLMVAANPPGRILDLVRSGRLRLAADDRVLAEYGEVLTRPHFACYFSKEDCERILGFIRFDALPVLCVDRFTDLPDPDDACFAECAAAANVPLVTGNLRHFPAKLRKRITVWTPSQFLDGFHRARRLRSSGLG